MPDAVALLQNQAEERFRQKKEEIVEYSDFLKEFVGDVLQSDDEADSEHSGSESEAETEPQMVVDEHKVADMQNKLMTKVVPLL